MLRVSGDPSASAFLSVDKKRKQLTLQEPAAATANVAAQQSSEDRRVGVSAPKMFAFDGLFTPEDTQVGAIDFFFFFIDANCGAPEAINKNHPHLFFRSRRTWRLPC